MVKKKKEIELVTEQESVEALTLNPIEEKSNAVDAALETKLSDLDGIGTVRLKKLYANFIFSVDDLLSCGEEELARMLDISYDDATKMTKVADQALRGAATGMIIKGKDFHNHFKKHIKYCTTGHDELDEILGKKDGRRGGYESAVITEYFGAYGSGKTQIMEVACIMAQMPEDACCLHCGQTDDLDKEFCDAQLDPEDKKSICGGKIWQGGGLGAFGKPARVVYIDTENSYRTDRMLDIIYNRQLVLTKPLTKTQEKQDANRQPLNEEEEEKAAQYIYNMDILTPKTTALQIMYIRNLSSIIKGDFCKECSIRKINDDGTPTHQDHPQAKSDMKLLPHDFEQDIPAKMVICDSLTGIVRKEFNGRGELSDRQMKIKMMIKHLSKSIESRNVVCLITNQVQEALGAMGDNIRPIGGNEIAHTSTHRIYLMKPQSIKKNKITAILVDSPNNAKNEIVFELGSKGIQSPLA